MWPPHECSELLFGALRVYLFTCLPQPGNRDGAESDRRPAELDAQSAQLLASVSGDDLQSIEQLQGRLQHSLQR